MARKTQEDLLNPERIIYRLIKDYSDGRLDKDRVLYRALIEEVDTVGGQLEAQPPNPPGSVRARIYTNGLDATTPSFALNIFHPFLPFNAMPPVSPGEHVYVMFEDPSMRSNGLWTGIIPAYSKQDYGLPEERLSVSPNSSNVFEGTRPPPVLIDSALDYGKKVATNVVQRLGDAIFGNEEDSIFKDKSILIIGDETLSGNVQTEIKANLNSKSAKKIVFKSESKSTIASWSRIIKKVISDSNPDVIFIFLGLNEKEFSEQKIDYFLTQLSGKQFAWIGPVKISTSSNPQLLQKDVFLEYLSDSLNSYIGYSYVETRSICSDYGRSEDGILFSGLGSKTFVDSIILRLEKK